MTKTKDTPKQESTSPQCPVCGSALSPIEETGTGKKLQRCSKGRWNPETRTTEGCSYVNWIKDPPKTLDEKCPKCGSALIEQTTRAGKKMKKCEKGGWDPSTKSATGCPYVDWGDAKQLLPEDCPQCGKKLVMQTTSTGKKLKKCETSGWDRVNKVSTGCTYVQWVNDGPPRAKKAAPPESEFGDMPDFE